MGNGLKVNKLKYYDITGKEHVYLELNRTQGLKYLLAEGFKPCVNPAYYCKGSVYANYNSVIKKWIITEP